MQVQTTGGATRNARIAGRLLVLLHNGDGVVRKVQLNAADGTKLTLAARRR